MMSSPSVLLPVLLGALLAWRIARRVRRLIGRQQVRPRRLIATTIFFPLLVVLFFISELRHIELVAALAGGVTAGIVVGVIGLRLTRFEATDAGLFYTPHAGIGIVLSLLLVGRLLYRFATLYLVSGRIDPQTMSSFGRSPLTLFVFGLVAGYYVTWAMGILRWRRAVTSTNPADPAPESTSGRIAPPAA